MASQVIHAEDFRVPERPSAIDQLRDMVHAPDDIDQATKKLGLDPRLLNMHLATVVDLSSLELGSALHIPVQISNHEGGRKSLYYLNVDEEVLAGVFVRDLGILLRYVKRTSGKAARAESGDTYVERLTTLDGTAVLESEGPLEVVDADRGQGRISLQSSSIQAEAEPVKRTGGWILWSCILID